MDREWRRKRVLERRELALNIVGDACVVCGTSDEIEMDHIDPSTKEFEIADSYSVSLDRYVAELKKCQPLCSKHHKEKTMIDRGFVVTKGRDVHGTLTSYKYCRCDRCKLAKRESAHLYYETVLKPRNNSAAKERLTLGRVRATVRKSP